MILLYENINKNDLEKLDYELVQLWNYKEGKGEKELVSPDLLEYNEDNLDNSNYDFWMELLNYQFYKKDLSIDIVLYDDELEEHYGDNSQHQFIKDNNISNIIYGSLLGVDLEIKDLLRNYSSLSEIEFYDIDEIHKVLDKENKRLEDEYFDKQIALDTQKEEAYNRARPDIIEYSEEILFELGKELDIENIDEIYELDFEQTKNSAYLTGTQIDGFDDYDLNDIKLRFSNHARTTNYRSLPDFNINIFSFLNNPKEYEDLIDYQAGNLQGDSIELEDDIPEVNDIINFILE